MKKLSLIAGIFILTLVGCSIGNGNPSINFGQLQSSQRVNNLYYNKNILQLFFSSSLLGGYNIESISTITGINYAQENLKTITAESVIFGNIPQLAEMSNVLTYKISYNTPGVPEANAKIGPNITVSGAVLIPESTIKIKGVVLFFHPTVFTKNTNTPSDFDASSDSLTNAALFAARGYVVIEPDYIGQGIDNSHMHPYVAYPEVNAASGIYMLSATTTLLQQLKITPQSGNDYKLYISSYSEGGAYALWAANLIQSGNYNNALRGYSLRRTIGISGAYDLYNGQMQMEFANVSNSKESTDGNYYIDQTVNPYHISDGGPTLGTQLLDPLIQGYAMLDVAMLKTALTGYALQAFSTYALAGDSSQIINNNFSNMQKCSTINVLNNIASVDAISCSDIFAGKWYNLYQLFNTPAINNGSTIVTQIFSSALANNFLNLSTLSPAQRAINKVFFTSNNSINAFVPADLITLAVFKQFMLSKSINNWTTQTPVTLIYLSHDSVVTNINSINAYNDMIAKAPAMVSRIVIDPENNTKPLYAIPILYSGLSAELYQTAIQLGFYLDHMYAEPFLLMAAYKNINDNP